MFPGFRGILQGEAIPRISDAPTETGEAQSLFNCRWASGPSRETGPGLASRAQEGDGNHLPPGLQSRINPDEMLNNDVKSNALRKRRPKHVQQLKTDVRSYLFSTQKRPDVVRSYFDERHVQYAKAEVA